MNITFDKTFELPCFDRCKSFYGKAMVIEKDDKTFLKSYQTIICYWDNTNKTFCRLWDGYSATTQRHINSFMRFIGFNLGGKHFWNCLECNKVYSISDILNII